MVRGRGTRERRAVVDQPGPARPEALDAVLVERLLELVQAAPEVVDRRAEPAGGSTAAARAHDLPEERMVGMAADVVAHGRPDLLGQRVEHGQHLLDGAVRVLGAGKRLVRVVDVGLVMLVVVEAHRLLVDGRFQRPVVGGKRGNLEGHAALLSSLLARLTGWRPRWVVMLSRRRPRKEHGGHARVQSRGNLAQAAETRAARAGR